MKNSAQITGLPIISILDGMQVGKVKSLVINPEKGSIDFLTIENEDWQVSVKAIPYKKVVGIGEFAVTVESDSAVIDLNEIPIANQLVNKKIKIKNTRIMTRKGELVGEVTEYFADEDTGQILGMTLKTSGKEVHLPSQYVLTYGKDIIIVKEDATDNFLETYSELDPAMVKPVVTPAIPETENPAPVISEVKSPVITEDTVTPGDDELGSLKRKQIDILNGKKLIKTIYDSKGQVLLEAGTYLTPGDITKAQEDGPSTVVELSMNVEA